MGWMLEQAWASLEGFARGLAERLPLIGVGFLVFLGFWLAGNLVKGAVCRVIRRAYGEEGLGRAIGRLARFFVLLTGFLVAAVIIFPGVTPADVLAVLGLGSVAIGFAFKDIFQNFLAGVLILARRPFRIGDQVRTGQLEGTVEDINLRATVLKTYDGERVVVPNSNIYTDPVVVRTAYGKRRSRFTVGIGYPDDIRTAKRVILTKLAAIDGVLDEPAPWVRTVELAPSSVNLEVFYWTRAFQADVLRVGDEVATTIKYALDEAGIDMPYPVQTVLFHPVGDHEAEQPREDRPQM